MQQVTSECDCEMWSERYELDKESPIHLLLDFQVRRGPCRGKRWIDNETYRCFFLHQSDIVILLLSGECKARVIVKWVVRVGVGVFRPQSGSPNHLRLDFQVRRGPCLGERRFDNETIRCFLDTQVSLAPTQWVVPMSDVSPSVGWSHFRISILSASLVALREKLKKADPNYFSILGLSMISWN